MNEALAIFRTSEKAKEIGTWKRCGLWETSCDPWIPVRCYDLVFPLHVVVFFLIIYSFFTVVGLCCCLGFSLVGTSRGYSLVAVLSLLITVASPVMEYGLSGMRASVVVACGLYSIGSIVVVYGLSCFSACGIFWDQGSKLCLLHWQAYFLPLSHQGSPACGFDAWS